MGADATQPKKRYGGITDQDSEGNAMLVSHAYLVQQDGEVLVKCDVLAAAPMQSMSYVDNDADPFTGGIRTQTFDLSNVLVGDDISYTFTVAKDEYFEIRGANCTQLILWRSHDGTVEGPIDYD